MDRTEASELWPTMKAYSEGKEIQFFNPAEKCWDTVSCPGFFDAGIDYRIKPEPKKRLMTYMEVLGKISVTPNMIIKNKQWYNTVTPILASYLHNYFDKDEVGFMLWALIDEKGNIITEWKKFEVEESEE